MITINQGLNKVIKHIEPTPTQLESIRRAFICNIYQLAADGKESVLTYTKSGNDIYISLTRDVYGVTVLIQDRFIGPRGGIMRASMD